MVGCFEGTSILLVSVLHVCRSVLGTLDTTGEPCTCRQAESATLEPSLFGEVPVRTEAGSLEPLVRSVGEGR